MKEKFKSLKTLVIQRILPWLTLICGIPAIICFATENFTMFEIFFQLTMLTGALSILSELVIGVAFLISAVVSSITKKNGKYTLPQKISIGLYSMFCIIGTFLLILLIIGLTYGQGI